MNELKLNLLRKPSTIKNESNVPEVLYTTITLSGALNLGKGVFRGTTITYGNFTPIAFAQAITETLAFSFPEVIAPTRSVPRVS
jgi:hypothetical protein